MSIDSRYKIPIDASANVHSVSAVGEQYLDLVSTGHPNKDFSPGQTITKGTVPAEIGPALDTANRGLAVLPKDKIAQLLDETAQSVGGLGPALQRLVDSTQAIVGDFKTNIADVNDILQNSGGVLQSQVDSGSAIERWARNLNKLGAQAAREDQSVRSVLHQAAPTADQVNDVFNDVRDSLPQTLANLEVVFDLLKRYHTGVEQVLVFLPQGASIAQTVAAPFPNMAALDLALSINQPPPCLTGFIPAAEWRSPADTSLQPLPSGTYCKIPMDTPANSVRGSRNIPCTDIPGKRAATPRECRDPKPYVPAGTNPWYGDPNQILTCPAPAARCDQPVKPGLVIPAPSVDNGMNPAPPTGCRGHRRRSATLCRDPAPVPCSATASSPTRVFTLRAGLPRRSTVPRAVSW